MELLVYSDDLRVLQPVPLCRAWTSRRSRAFLCRGADSVRPERVRLDGSQQDRSFARGRGPAREAAELSGRGGLPKIAARNLSRASAGGSGAKYLRRVRYLDAQRRRGYTAGVLPGIRGVGSERRGPAQCALLSETGVVGGARSRVPGCGLENLRECAGVSARLGSA